VKEKITERPILVLPNFGKTFQVRCDASGVAIGAVLSQDNMHVAYFSEKLMRIRESTPHMIKKLCHNSSLEEMEALTYSKGICLV
jgi:hypothetical protein